MNPLTAPTSERPVLHAERRAPVRLTPARPAAVIVPALACVGGAVTVAAVLEATLGTHRAILGALAGALFAVVVLAHGYAFHVLVRTRLRGPRGQGLHLALTAALVLAVGLVLPSGALHPVTLVATLVLSVLGLRTASKWRRGWLRHLPTRVSLLAPSEMAAEEAVERLEALPGLIVESVVVPGAVVDRASRMLGRPVARAVGGRLRLADRVVVSCPQPDPHVGSTVAQLVALGHTITSETAAMRRAEGRVDSERANALNLLMGLRPSKLANALRRFADVVVSVLVLLGLAPVFLAACVAIVLDSRGGIFYRQGRVGRRGRLFQMLKFRTMHEGAERISGPVFASEHDPRITRVGSFLRRYRIDELPQFVNVLRGEMALVGPRPERPHFMNVLRRDVPLFELRTCVRPGITGWAQIRLPYADDSDDARAKLEYDLYYITHRSLSFDLAILLETVGVVLSGAGAR